MTGDQMLGLAWISMCLVLVVSGLVARRLSAKRTITLALIWAGIFGLAFAVARLLA